MTVSLDTPRAPYAGQLPAPQPQVPVTKAAGDGDEWEEAVKWAEEASNAESA